MYGQFDNTVGQRIREERHAANMTMEELGQQLGIQKSAVRKYEAGEIATIPRSKIIKMAQLFNVSPSYLMGFTDEKNTLTSTGPTCNIYEFCSRLNVRPLLEQLTRLDEIDRGKVLERVATLLEADKYSQKP